MKQNERVAVPSKSYKFFKRTSEYLASENMGWRFYESRNTRYSMLCKWTFYSNRIKAGKWSA